MAPCEIASVATTAMAGGEAAPSAGVLIGSTVAAVAVAGPVLSIGAGPVDVHPGGIIVNLTLVVALPMVVGLLRSCTPMGNRFDRAATATATVTVAALVALIAAEVHISTSYLTVAAALVVFLTGSAIVGRVLALGAGRPTAVAVLLTTSMRDSPSPPASRPPPLARPPPHRSGSTASWCSSGAPPSPAWSAGVVRTVTPTPDKRDSRSAASPV